MAHRALVVAALLAFPFGSFAQVKALNTQGVRMEPLAAPPTNCGASNPCIYYNVTSNTFKQINNAGVAVDIPITGGGAGTLQDAYNGGSNIALSGAQEGIDLTAYGGQTTPAISIKKDGNGSGLYYALKIFNTSTAAGGASPQNAGGILFAGSAFRGNTPTGAQPDQWYFGPDGSLTIAEDTAHFYLVHSYDGLNFLHGLNITLQDCFPNCTDSEVIFSTFSEPYMINYPKTDPTDGHGVNAFWGSNGNAFVFGTALSGRRIRMTTTNGLSPDTAQDVLVDFGQIDNATLRFKKIVGREIETPTIPGETGATLPESSYGFRARAWANATSGNQVYSPHYEAWSSGYDTLAAAARAVHVFEQLVPVQETTAPPTINYNWSTQVTGINASSQVRATLRSGRFDDTDGGEFVTGHFCGMGAAPGIAAGAAAGTGPTVSLAAGSTDAGGTIVVTMGTSTTTGTIATITFANTFHSTNPPSVTIDRVDSDAATLGFGAYVNQASTTTSTFVLTAGTAPTASTEYRWSYKTIGD